MLLPDNYYQCLWAIALFSNLFLLRPLLMIARERTALFLVVGKSCFCLLYIIATLSQFFGGDSSVVMRIRNQLSLCDSIHVALLALNRFHAMMWPISYARHWLKKRTFLLIWLVLCPIACAFYFCANEYTRQYTEGARKRLFNAILSQFIMTVAVIIPSICYCLLSLKILCDRAKLGSNWREITALDKDRLRMFVIFFCSLLPHLIKQLNSSMSSLFPGYIKDTILDELVFVNFVLANSCGEEIFLLILCKDFRIAVKQQLLDFYAYWSCRRQLVETRVEPFTVSTGNLQNRIRGSSSRIAY